MSDRARRTRQLFALLRQAGATHNEHHELFTRILYRPIESTNDLSDIELQGCIDVLRYWDRLGNIKDHYRSLMENPS